ncbi:helix-turn-helix transcriptional regulator [Corynebacterium breve]|uniref:Helix-turn-helix transcriptional regulator n=1 Tax=Corynebacterium breve TaxID=3049799 RepID=A0ABY8VJS8_9CORY|nr:helix-turn-helix transcriptional regulator [Corynebacterium breve]WIM69040.1 helix-turn-helix transcriptional regulator [Corynebacterium breve]
MATTTALLEKPTLGTELIDSPVPSVQQPEPLLREALGLSLRAFRADKGVTLRELAQRARVSPGYLSELERGRKEVSSELLAAVCNALGTTVAEVLVEAAQNMTLQSMAEELAQTSPAAAEA